jgi:hypothetical protein
MLSHAAPKLIHALAAMVLSAVSLAPPPPSTALAATGPAEDEAARRTALAQGERAPQIRPTDLAARERFLEVERFARLPEDQQGKGFAEFYRTRAPYYMNSILEGVLSSYPTDILDRHAFGNPGGDAKAVWARQLADAAAVLTPEEVADKLGIRLWLDVAGRARVSQLLKQRPDAVAALIREDLAATNLATIQRACVMISDLGLRQFTDQVLALYLGRGPLSEPAATALIWLADPAIVRPLLEQIEKDPKSIIRHAGLFQGPLAGRPAEPALVRLLDSSDADVRYSAAMALSECRDPTLAAPIVRLAQASAPRLQSAALTLATRLPDDAFTDIREDLAPLLASKDSALRLEATACFARHKDILAGPSLCDLLKQDRIDPGQGVTVMQALNALAGSSFSYDLHHWGPTANRQAMRIMKFTTVGSSAWS